MFALVSRYRIDVAVLLENGYAHHGGAPDQPCAPSGNEHAQAFILNHGFERIKPLIRFHDIWIIDGLRQNLVYLG
jgi:hypothetical protein